MLKKIKRHKYKQLGLIEAGSEFFIEKKNLEKNILKYTLNRKKKYQNKNIML